MLEILDTFIGLITIYLVLSLVVAAVGEAITSFANFRGATLFNIVENLLGREKALEVFTHAKIRSMCSRVRLPLLGLPRRLGQWWSGKSVLADRALGGRIIYADQCYRLPSYLAPELFCEALLDTLVNPPTYPNSGQSKKPLTINTIDQALQAGKTVGAEAYLVSLYTMWIESGYQQDSLKQSMVTWFDRTADRASGWFKRRLSRYLLAVGFVAAALLNADTFQMFNSLSNNPELRQYMVDTAKSVDTLEIKFNSDGSPEGTFCQANSAHPLCSKQSVAKALLPSLLPVLGWNNARVSIEKTCWYPDDACWKQEDSVRPWDPLWLVKLLGFLLTATAVSLGAPFWFDLLHKIIQLRGKISTSSSATQPVAEKPRNTPALVEAPQEKMLIARQSIDHDLSQSIDSFDPNSYGYSPINLFWSARLAKMAYEDQTVVTPLLRQFGADGIVINHKASDTQCLLVLTPRALLVSFRGTENKAQDWLTDAHVAQTIPQQLYPGQDKDDGCRVHSGFFQALFCENISPKTCSINDMPDSAWKRIYEYLETNAVKDKNIPIWVSGHSLGGALAVLAALKLSAEGFNVAAIHTFGQPRVANPELAEKIDQIFGQKYYRSINHSDIVPRVPFPKTPDPLNHLAIQEYAHAGRVIYFNDLAQAMMDPPLWYRGIDALGIDLTFIEQAQKIKDTARQDRLSQAEVEWQEKLEGPKDKLKDMVGDHGMDRYLQLHQGLLVST